MIITGWSAENDGLGSFVGWIMGTLMMGMVDIFLKSMLLSSG